MIKKQKTNRFDVLVENLVKDFSKINNIDLLAEGKGKDVFNIIAYRLSEIASYKELVCNHFFPATNKAIHDSRSDFLTSKYKFLLNSRDIDFFETLYDTVRLAYVGLFHKIENYVNDVSALPDSIFEELYSSDLTVSQWAKEKFDFDIKNWRHIYIIQKINWISNCVKHKDGFPVKEPKPKGFENIDESKRIRLTPAEFKSDCETLIKVYPIYLQILFIFAQHKYFVEEFLSPEKMDEYPELVAENLSKKNIMEGLINKLISTITANLMF